MQPSPELARTLHKALLASLDLRPGERRLLTLPGAWARERQCEIAPLRSGMQGVFSRRTDSLELYRVKDASFVQPFVMRLVGIGIVELETSDATTPVLQIRGVPDADALRERILKAVDAVRDRKGVRELDVPGGHLHS